MSTLVNAETATWQAAKEATPGTLATTGWKEFQVNPGGLGQFKADVNRIRRNPLSRKRSLEAGQIVDLKAEPTIQHDLNKDLFDFFGDAIFLSTGKHSGNTGLSVFKPTAATSTAFTVAASGALTQNHLVRARGFVNAANNGVKQVGAASTATSIVIAGGLTAETVSGYVALVEVCGWRGASGDIGIDVNGNITSIAADFTTMGIQVGQEIFVGGDAGVAGNNFATTAYRGVAKVKSIAAHLLTLERRAWTVGAADPGTGKTIDLYFGRYWRNVSSDHADSLTAEASQPAYSLEVALPGAGAAAATSYMYGLGSMVNTCKIDAPDRNKVVTSLSFVGRDMQQPTTTRATGAGASEAPIATALFNTVDHVGLFLRVANTDESALLVDIQSWSMTISNNISPQNQQGTLGGKRMVIGKFTVDVDVKGFLVQDDVPKAVRDSRLATFGAMLRNADCAIFVDVPQVQLDDGDLDFPENGPVMIGTKLEASRESTTYSITAGVSTFPYAPAS